MINDHESDIAVFQQEADYGKNTNLKSWADNTLPTLREHLRQATIAQADVGVISSLR